jgi:stage II sporulation protein D
MHHVIAESLQDELLAPFIKGPDNGQFGQVKKYSISKRGRSGTAMYMQIETSRGNWTIAKELVIRSVFKNPEIKLTRLKSARLFFDHEYDHLGLLSKVTISGMGWGHGVGMQQTGAQGLAKQGKNYKQILAHYFQDCTISVLA